MIAERHSLSFSSNCLSRRDLLLAIRDASFKRTGETHSVKKFQIELLLRLVLSASGYFSEIAHSLGRCAVDAM